MTIKPVRIRVASITEAGIADGDGNPSAFLMIGRLVDPHHGGMQIQIAFTDATGIAPGTEYDLQLTPAK